MKRTQRQRTANSNSLPGSRGSEKNMRGTMSSVDTATTAGNDIVERRSRSPDVEQSGRKAAAKGVSRTQLRKHKGIRNNPTPSAETLLNRQTFDAGLRRGLLQAATSNLPLPAWLLHRKSYDRVGEFYVRLKAELVAPERRDHAKIKRMLAELHSSQQQDAKQLGGPDDTVPEQVLGDVHGPDAEDGDEVPVEIRPTGGPHQQSSDAGDHMQCSTNVNPNAIKYQDGLRRGLLDAAENGTLLSGYVQARSVASLGDFWVRLKTELLSSKRDEHKIKRMLGELRHSERKGPEATDDEPFSGREVEQEEEADQNSGDTLTTEADMRLEDQQFMDDDSDDVFVRRPRRLNLRLAMPQVEEEL